MVALADLFIVDSALHCCTLVSLGQRLKTQSKAKTEQTEEAEITEQEQKGNEGTAELVISSQQKKY